MFASIYSPGIEKSRYADLVECAFSFSPMLEETTSDTVTIDIAGSELLFGHPSALPARISAACTKAGITVRSAAAPNPDAAVHAARGGLSFVPEGGESQVLQNLAIELLVPQLAKVPETRFQEILQTLFSWGIRSFGAFAALPREALSERLGQEGVRLQRMAAGISDRAIVPKIPEQVFSQSIELEIPVDQLEPLLFLFARLVNQFCASLSSRSLAVSALHIALKLVNNSIHSIDIQLPLPLREHKTILKILQLEVASRLPPAPVKGIGIFIESARPRAIQFGLFHPLSPEPEKLELVMARISKLVGRENVGCAEILDSHRPDAFRMKHFRGIQPGILKEQARKHEHWRRTRTPVLRAIRPPARADVEMRGNRPAAVLIRANGIRSEIAGKVVALAGPWRSSGDWWNVLSWGRDEWDAELSDGVLCRIYRDLQSGLWFIDGTYD